MKQLKVLSEPNNNGKRRRCLSCGTQEIKGGRRYCSSECRRQMNWVLSLSTGLLRVFNARYAAFSFDTGHVVLDVLPVWSRGISRFTYRRTNGKRPAEDLKHLILNSGSEWYEMIQSRTSKSYASLYLLKRNHDHTLEPDSILPDRKVRPRLSRHEREYVKRLELKAEELLSEGHVTKIKSSYRKLAKLYHPDVGGDARKFRELDEAHRQMLLWAQKPQFTTRRALQGCWSYDGSTNKWSPPL